MFPLVLQAAGSKLKALAAVPGLLRQASSGAGGLFSLDLHSPECFARNAAAAKHRCQGLMSQILASPGDASVVQLMDDMSDELCRTYDAAEACRNIHGDKEWKLAATKACVDVGAFIAEVNNHPGIYTSLSNAMDNYYAAARQQASNNSSPSSTEESEFGSDRISSGEVASCSGRSSFQKGSPAQSLAKNLRQDQRLTRKQLQAFCPETVMVGSKLKLDMEKAGIHLPPERQARMQELTNASSHFAARFNATLVDPKQLGSVSIKQEASFYNNQSSSSGRLRERLHAFTGRVSEHKVPLDGSSVGAVLAQDPDAQVRQAVYEAAGKSPASNLALLEQMLLARSEMASMVECDSYSRYKAWGASLAQDPAAIDAFLLQLAQAVKPVADHEVKTLQGLKASLDSGTTTQASTSALMPWDVDFLIARSRLAAGAAAMNRQLQEYTVLPVVLKGFAQIMEQLFGLTLTISPASRTEVWAPGVLKCEAQLEGSMAGTVYLDLCSRPGKYPSAVTFPIRCGRRLQDGSYQPPIMALLTDFGHGSVVGPEAVRLTLRELRTLVHELGHCCHNLLSRTKYQHLWGTRCAQDMVEVPSHLWEHFVSDPRTLRLMARHHITGEHLPYEVCNKVLSGRRLFAGLELQQQVLLSLVDQAYHGKHAHDVVQQGTGATWERVVRPHASLPSVSGLRPEARVGHFTIYGGAYYSYLYARCLSSGIWSSLLTRDPLDRGAGDIIRRKLLAPGGSLEPWDVLSSLDPKESFISPVGCGWMPVLKGLPLSD